MVAGAGFEPATFGYSDLGGGPDLEIAPEFPDHAPTTAESLASPVEPMAPWIGLQ